MVYVEGVQYRLVRSRHIVAMMGGLSQGEAVLGYHLRRHLEKIMENGGVVNSGSMIVVLLLESSSPAHFLRHEAELVDTATLAHPGDRGSTRFHTHGHHHQLHSTCSAITHQHFSSRLVSSALCTQHQDDADYHDILTQHPTPGALHKPHHLHPPPSSPYIQPSRWYESSLQARSKSPPRPRDTGLVVSRGVFTMSKRNVG